jgi:hypothetical protein
MILAYFRGRVAVLPQFIHDFGRFRGRVGRVAGAGHEVDYGFFEFQHGHPHQVRPFLNFRKFSRNLSLINGKFLSILMDFPNDSDRSWVIGHHFDSTV